MKIKSYLILVLLISFLPLTAFANDVYYYHTDNFGTPMVMTDAAGEVVWRSDELPFGEEYETIENPIKNNRRYLGKELDEESGLIYLGNRFLDPDTGRMNRPDPIGLVDPATGKINMEMLLNPQRQNRYTYGLNNPYRYVDPDGEFAFVGAALIGAAIAYFSHPDVANAPESSSSPTYESHGAQTIALGAVTGVATEGVGSVLVGRKVVNSISRTTRSGDKAVRLTRRNGAVTDISPQRVKEFTPNKHPKAPLGTLSRVKVKNALPGSKGFKRLPTKKDLKILKKYHR